MSPVAPMLLALTVCSCYGVVGEEGLAAPTDDAGPGNPTGTGTGPGKGTTTGPGTTGAGGATGAGGGTGSGGKGGTGGSGTGGATGSGGATGTGGTAGTGSGGAGAGGAGSGGAGAGGAAGAGTGGAGTGGTAGTGTGGAIDAGTGKGGTAGTGGAAGTSGAGGTAGSGTVDAAVPPICTSMTNWTSGNNANMRPGDACVACHSNFTIAGTVYPTLHEPLNCNGKSGVQVVITPASGTALTLNTNTAGNFYSTTKITTPYSAKVVVNGMERPMMAKQTSGNCNSCHTQNGAQSAPGRIIVP